MPDGAAAAELYAGPHPVIIYNHGGVMGAGRIILAEILESNRLAYRLKLFEGGSHDLVENYGEVRMEMDRWFDRYLRDRLPAPPNGVAALPGEGRR